MHPIEFSPDQDEEIKQKSNNQETSGNVVKDRSEMYKRQSTFNAESDAIEI